VVAAVAADGPTGTLRPGDVVVGCGATAIGSRGDLLQCVAQAPAGTKLQLRVLRGEAELTLEVTVGTDGALPGLELVTLDPRVEGPVTVSFDAGDVSGPSAGLMFALELIDRLHGSLELLGRGRVAGTGIIDADGRVAPVGGAELKVIAAERAGAAYFLVPAANAAVAARAAKSIRVVPVHSVEHAVEQLLARR
jgi:PDZ domain-containing protein